MIVARLRSEDGIALVMALMFCVALTSLVIGVTTYVTSNQHSATNSASDQRAQNYAEAALNFAYSKIQYANAHGTDPTLPTLLGCATGTLGSSDCTASGYPQPQCLAFGGTCGASPSPGTASVYGFFSGTGSRTYNNTLVKASTWLVIATGYDENSAGKVNAKTATATVTVDSLTSDKIASAWNHVFITAPRTNPETCQLSFGGQSANTVINSPLYVVGNLCLPGNAGIQESDAQHPIDLQVGGGLYLGSGTSVGASKTSPITSGVVVGGCTTVSITSTWHPCAGTSPSYNYWVKNTDSFANAIAPTQTDANILNDYKTFDPGPMHPCANGTNPFDIDQTMNDNNPTFDLTPATPYSCISTSGANVGQLTWDGSTLTVNGSIYIDGNVTTSRSAVYTGVGVIEFSGSFTMSNNNQTLCAVSSCDFSTWQSGTKTSMLLLASTLHGTSPAAFNFTGNKQTFQGSLWTQPDAAANFGANTTKIQGPLSIGTITSNMQNTTLEPLPVIKKMPLGAPVPPNVSVTIEPLVITK